MGVYKFAADDCIADSDSQSRIGGCKCYTACISHKQSIFHGTAGLLDLCFTSYIQVSPTVHTSPCLCLALYLAFEKSLRFF